jgi:hypothetical protein
VKGLDPETVDGFQLKFYAHEPSTSLQMKDDTFHLPIAAMTHSASSLGIPACLTTLLVLLETNKFMSLSVLEAVTSMDE